MERAVLLTGLVRDAERFCAMLRAVDAHRGPDDGIIFSTWHGELDRWPEPAALLAALGAEVLTQEEPGPRTHGHLLHQILALDAGLSRCDDDTVVMRTRGDLGTPEEVEAFFAAAPVRPRVDGPLPSPFRHKVAIRGFFPAQPFFINDISFAGRAGDLRALARLPLTTIASWSRTTGTEQMIWGSAFAGLHPELDRFFRLNPGHVFNDAELHARISDGLMRSRLYHRVVALALLHLDQAADWLVPAPDGEQAAELARALTLEELLWSPRPTPGVIHHAGCLANFIWQEAVGRVLFAGEHAPSAFGEAVGDMMRTYRAGDGCPTGEALEAEAEELYQVTANEPVLAGVAQRLVGTGPVRSMTGALPDWLGERGAADSIRHLETELVGLRRANDQLVQRLRAVGG